MAAVAEVPRRQELLPPGRKAAEDLEAVRRRGSGTAAEQAAHAASECGCFDPEAAALTP